MSSFHSSNLRHVHLSLNRGIIEIPKKIPNDKNPISLTPECPLPSNAGRLPNEFLKLEDIRAHKCCQQQGTEQSLTCRRRRNE